MDAREFFQKLDTMTKEEAFAAYSIKYYTVDDLLNDKVIGKGVRKLYEKNYMLDSNI
ncbi:hypothetical protein NEMIN01_0256 [Nematocida minor]|uniref:uncharacterized protein n=1 Tax=Nematocida minor TaxID=1912983 RepID=UPI00221E8DCB|nr:uncharacterized protein NEMIN01_0256 [Nematocida minor]KAI5189090.1 hypothetical protein NEMIN01_0256 [Nematocida minor]